MQIIKREPFKEINRFFDDKFLYNFTSFPDFTTDLAVDVYEEKDMVIARMNLPGIKTEEISIVFKNDMLVVSGKREEEHEIDKKNYYSKEIKRGLFSRSVALPQTIDASKSEATYENGELIVKMPIIENGKDKTIKISIKK